MKSNKIIYHLLGTHKSINPITNYKNFVKLANSNYETFKMIDKLSIIHLTKEIRIPSQLKHLIIRKCKKGLFDTLTLPTSLEILELEYCNNININDLKSKCPYLKQLIIFICKLNNENRFIEQLPNTLEKIKIFLTPIERINIPLTCKSFRVSRIKSLKELNIESENDEIFSQLEKFEIYDCQIKNLLFLKSCKNLKQIEIIKNITEKIEFPNNLKILKLRYCGLKTLPNLPSSIEILDLVRNRLNNEQLSKILKCNNLKYLQLSSNNFKGILDVSHMNNLVKLFGTRNNFTEIKYPNSQVELEINSNKLTQFPELKPNIKFLNICSNPMELSLEEIKIINNFNSKIQTTTFEFENNIENDIENDIENEIENDEESEEDNGDPTAFYDDDENDEEFLTNEYTQCHKMNCIVINDDDVPPGYECFYNSDDILLIRKKENIITN